MKKVDDALHSTIDKLKHASYYRLRHPDVHDIIVYVDLLSKICRGDLFSIAEFNNVCDWDNRIKETVLFEKFNLNWISDDAKKKLAKAAFLGEVVDKDYYPSWADEVYTIAYYDEDKIPYNLFEWLIAPCKKKLYNDYHLVSRGEYQFAKHLYESKEFRKKK